MRDKELPTPEIAENPVLPDDGVTMMPPEAQSSNLLLWVDHMLRGSKRSRGVGYLPKVDGIQKIRNYKKFPFDLT
jgi:DNA-binding helix-hairpin-helix protein with protein kinase domain